MSLAEELLEHARFLAMDENQSKLQASLRRAVSAAYYSVFHLLSAEVGAYLIPVDRSGVRETIQRKLEHSQMKRIAETFSKASRRQQNAGKGAGNQSDPQVNRKQETDSELLFIKLLPDPISANLAYVAEEFAELQDARHDADYDVTSIFDPSYVRALVSKAEGIFNAWKIERSSPNASVFLQSLMFGAYWTTGWRGKNLSQ